MRRGAGVRGRRRGGGGAGPRDERGAGADRDGGAAPAAPRQALGRIDAALHAVVETVGSETPPSSPAIGEAWALGASPTGAWAGQSGALAAWTSGGWRFIAPVPGMLAWSLADSAYARWGGSAWTIGSVAGVELRIGGTKVVGPQQAAIPGPTGGATTDAEARAAVAAVLAALRAHGLIAS